MTVGMLGKLFKITGNGILSIGGRVNNRQMRSSSASGSQLEQIGRNPCNLTLRLWISYSMTGALRSGGKYLGISFP